MTKGTLEIWIGEGTGDLKSILDYPGGPFVITMVIIRRQECQCEM